MDEMQANCPPEPEGVNAFKITRTFPLRVCAPLRGFPRASWWLLIQTQQLYQVTPPNQHVYSPPAAPDAHAHNLQLLSLFVFLQAGVCVCVRVLALFF